MDGPDHQVIEVGQGAPGRPRPGSTPLPPGHQRTRLSRWGRAPPVGRGRARPRSHLAISAPGYRGGPPPSPPPQSPETPPLPPRPPLPPKECRHRRRRRPSLRRRRRCRRGRRCRLRNAATAVAAAMRSWADSDAVSGSAPQGRSTGCRRWPGCGAGRTATPSAGRRPRVDRQGVGAGRDAELGGPQRQLPPREEKSNRHHDTTDSEDQQMPPSASCHHGRRNPTVTTTPRIAKINKCHPAPAATRSQSSSIVGTAVHPVRLLPKVLLINS